MIKPKDAKIIEYPQGGGSATKSFKLRNNDFFDISHGTFGGIRCTTVSLKGLHIYEKLCFEGHVEFTTHKQIWTALAKDIPLLIKIINLYKERKYEEGYLDGKTKVQKEIQIALGLGY